MSISNLLFYKWKSVICSNPLLSRQCEACCLVCFPDDCGYSTVCRVVRTTVTDGGTPRKTGPQRYQMTTTCARARALSLTAENFLFQLATENDDSTVVVSHAPLVKKRERPFWIILTHGLDGCPITVARMMDALHNCGFLVGSWRIYAWSTNYSHCQASS